LAVLAKPWQITKSNTNPAPIQTNGAHFWQIKANNGLDLLCLLCGERCGNPGAP